MYVRQSVGLSVCVDVYVWGRLLLVCMCVHLCVACMPFMYGCTHTHIYIYIYTVMCMNVCMCGAHVYMHKS